MIVSIERSEMGLTLVENLKKGYLSKETKRGSLSLTKSTYSSIVLAVIVGNFS